MNCLNNNSEKLVRSNARKRRINDVADPLTIRPCMLMTLINNLVADQTHRLVINDTNQVFLNLFTICAANLI